MSELFTPPHPRHEHLELPTAASWPEQHAEESQLLALARRTANVAIPANYLPPQEYITELEQRYGVDDTRARLGDAYPQLSPEQDAAVVVRFANIYRDIHSSYQQVEPSIHNQDQVGTNHHDHARDHDHDHDACGHNHGIVHQKIGKLEQKVLNKVSDPRARKLAAAALRATSLLFCPGDDIAAIGLQVYGSVSGEAHGHSEQHVAILPKEPRIERANQRVRLPVPRQKPENQPAPPSTSSQRESRITLKERLNHTVEQGKQKLQRAALIGIAAVAMAGTAFGGDSSKEDISPVQEQKSAVPSIELLPPAALLPVFELPEATPKAEITPVTEQEQPPTHLITIQPGQTQWSINSQRSMQTIGTSEPVLINALTAYTSYVNQEKYPDPHTISAGEQLQAPTESVIHAFNTALFQPQHVPEQLAHDISALSATAFASAEAKQEVLERIATAIG